MKGKVNMEKSHIAIVLIQNVNIAIRPLQKPSIYCIVIVLWVKRLSERSSL